MPITAPMITAQSVSRIPLNSCNRYGLANGYKANLPTVGFDVTLSKDFTPTY